METPYHNITKTRTQKAVVYTLCQAMAYIPEEYLLNVTMACDIVQLCGR